MKILIRFSFIYIFLSFLLSSCGADINDLRNIGKEPPFNETIYPVEDPYYSPQNVAYLNHHNDPNQINNNLSNNSLWKPGSRDFFRDRRARSVGDILKINIHIKDNANLDNEVSRNKTGAENVATPNLFGYESHSNKIFPKALSLSNLINMTGTNSHVGTGKIQRKEDVQTEIAAMVMRILPSGMLVIQGRQEVRVNYEIREITVSGIVRSEDIGADNSINLDQIAEARVSYGGRGVLTRLQKPRYGAEFLEVMSPF